MAEQPLFTDRLVLKDGTVVLPEEIESVQYFYDREKGRDSEKAFLIITFDGRPYGGPLSHIRRDRYTGEHDRDGKEIFENDMDNDGNVVRCHHTGEWMLCSSSGAAFPLWCLCGLAITGMVPFGEESC